MSPETVNVYPLNPVTAIETIHELSACSVSPNVSELFVLPVLVREYSQILNCLPVQFRSVSLLMNCLPTQFSPDKILMDFPASVLETVYALSVFCVSVFPRLQSLLWVPDQPVSP